MKIIKNEQGFVVSVTAIIVAVILGFLVLYFSNSIALNVTSSSNDYSSSQAHWSAVSGIEATIMKLRTSGLNGIAGTYPFYNSDITIDTLTIDPVNQIMQMTSRGTHSSTTRILAIKALPAPADTLIGEGFENSDDLIITVQPGFRYWGISCEEGADDYNPDYIFLNGDDCYFYGSKAQNNSFVEFQTIDVSGIPEINLSLSLAGGVDDAVPDKQNKFQNGDYFEILVNGIQLEYWQGPVGPQGPMSPTLGNATEDLVPYFQTHTFNLSEIFGPLTTLDIMIIGNQNSDYKFVGVDSLALTGSGGWNAIGGSIIEI